MTLRLRNQELEWRQIDDEIVALDVQDGSYLATNGSAALLWRALAAGTTREHLVRQLIDEYGIDEPRASDDVDAFLRSLAACGLLAD